MTNQSAKNYLGDSKNPYLLQHADNPVHWYPWGYEAFAEAKKQDEPVFLSIGYATCHWCHVMAHESFEDEAVAELMNRTFINIKVDREERPDIDNTYMHVCQLLTGRGGWPLTIVMTPEKQPFYAATYIPKTGRQGQPGMMELIPRLSHIWKNEREKIDGSAGEITRAFQKSISPQTSQPLPDDILSKAFSNLHQQFDEENGGFGGAPKFPTPHTLVFLLRYAHRFDDTQASAMVETTLTKMRRGGLFDHLGGGFHRYSTDRRWLLPHFEKMLYDQAMHLMAYTDGWQVTGNPLFKQTVEETTSYLFRDLQDESGAFYSAEDADSEGEEGTFYLWNVEEIKEILSAADAQLAIKIFNLKPKGNFSDEATGQPDGKNILHQRQSISALAAEQNLSEEQLHQKLKSIQQQLFKKREQRERPFLDDKILTDWNGLAIAALSKAGRVFDQPEYVRQAERAAAFIFEHLTQENRLLHRYRGGEAAITGTADDYAFFIWGLFELYESTFKTAYLKKAIELQKTFLNLYWDETSGGFFFSAKESEDLLGRKKEFFDSALPSANSVAAMNLLRLGRITAHTEWEDKAEQITSSTSEMVKRAPASFTQLLQAHLWATGSTGEIVIAGEKDQPDTQAFLQTLHHTYLPSYVILLNDEETNIQSLAPFVRHQPMIEGKATAYVCRNYSCRAPTHDPKRMKQTLKQ